MDGRGGTGARIDADALPCGVAEVDAEGRVALANATLCDWLGRPREAVVGARLVDLLTPAGRIYFETHLRPLLAVQGAFAEVAIELAGAEGARLGVTMEARAEARDGVVGRAWLCVHRNEQRRAYERELMARRLESERFAAVVRASPDAILVIGPDGRIETWNPAATALFGWTEAEAMGRDGDALLVPPEEGPLAPEALAAIDAGADLRDAVERRHKDGRAIPVRRAVAAVRDPVGRVQGRVAIFGDISEQRRSEAQVATLVRELAHRTKNILAVVGVIARQTARVHEGESFPPAFMARLKSLARNQDLLTDGGGARTHLGALVRSQVEPLDAAERIRAEGPRVDLSAPAAQAIGMAIYELGTNAAKYGALSEPSGRVTVGWAVADGRLALDWQESGGPAVARPTRTGFGSQVTGALLEASLGGRVRAEFAPEGLRWRLEAPVAGLG